MVVLRVERRQGLVDEVSVGVVVRGVVAFCFGFRFLFSLCRVFCMVVLRVLRRGGGVVGATSTGDVLLGVSDCSVRFDRRHRWLLVSLDAKDSDSPETHSSSASSQLMSGVQSARTEISFKSQLLDCIVRCSRGSLGNCACQGLSSLLW